MHRDADIEIDFEADWYQCLRDSLVAEGYTPPPGDVDAARACLNLRKRTIQSGKRKLHVSPNLVCPPSHRAGYDELVRRIAMGDDLRPYQTTSLDRLDFNEGQLNDWGIFHLHLGDKPHPKNPDFVERTGPVLFAWFEEADAFFIAIEQHGPGHHPWTNIALIEELDRQWPELLEPFVVVGVPIGRNPTEQDIRTLRSKNGNTLLSVNGRTVGWLGGGISSSGISSEVVIYADWLLDDIEAKEKVVVSNKEQILREVERAAGLSVSRPTRVKLDRRTRLRGRCSYRGGWQDSRSPARLSSGVAPRRA